jgi:uncharacterized tellurite resistance protein B-like protein
MKFLDILQLIRQGKGTARSHMKNLIELAAVDGNFEEVEYSLLRQIAKRNNVSAAQLEEIRKNPAGILFETPQDEREKFTQLYDLVHMMIVDKNVHEEERSLCNLFAIKFGYPRPKVPELIETLRLNILNGQSIDEAYKRAGWLLS